jgi:hypothetical protein
LKLTVPSSTVSRQFRTSAGSYQSRRNLTLANLVEIRCADLHCPVAQVIGVSDLRGVAKESVARKLVGDVLFILAPACRADADILATESQFVR